MKLTCMNCSNEYDGMIFKDELGWHGICLKCGSSFDVDIPNTEGKIVMAFTDPVEGIIDPYIYFTNDFTGQGIHTMYMFDTPKEFIDKWNEIYNKPNGMWYWVIDEDEYLVCSGACDPGDIDIFEDYWEKELKEKENKPKVKAKVRLTHTVEMFVEAESEEAISDWLAQTTPKEAYNLSNHNADQSYDEEIVCFVRNDSEVDYVIE